MGATSMSSAKCRLCGTVVFTAEQIPRISGPSKFKPVLFKGQLYYTSKIGYN